jgi:hypothetical protein
MENSPKGRKLGVKKGVKGGFVAHRSMGNTIDPCDHTTHPLAAPEKLDTTEALDLKFALALART